MQEIVLNIENATEIKEVKNIKRTKRTKRKFSSEELEVFRAVHDLNEELEVCFNNFNNILDHSLIDSKIYEILSLEKKLEFYILKAKKLNVCHPLIFIG